MFIQCSTALKPYLVKKKNKGRVYLNLQFKCKDRRKAEPHYGATWPWPSNSYPWNSPPTQLGEDQSGAGSFQAWESNNVQAAPSLPWGLIQCKHFHGHQFPKEEGRGKKHLRTNLPSSRLLKKTQNWPPQLACNYFLLCTSRRTMSLETKGRTREQGSSDQERMRPKRSWEAGERSSPSILTCRFDPGACC